jgi:hypothetical protein
MFRRAINLLHLAKQSEIEILLKEEQLQLRLPKNKVISQSLLKEIKDNKQLIIDFLSKHKISDKNSNKLVKVDKTLTGRIPLSFSQERLLFMDKLAGSVQYHIPAVLRLKGKMNRDALEYALQTIVIRHEVLRTVIREGEEGDAYQQVKEPNAWNFSVVDGSGYKADPCGLQQYIETLIKAPFDLSKDYMLRADLISLDEEEHVLVVTMHHIASDGWSISILVKEVVELYSSYEEDRPMELAPLEIQYADYSIWQRQYLVGEVLKKKVGYWKKKLKGSLRLKYPAIMPGPQSKAQKVLLRDLR